LSTTQLFEMGRRYCTVLWCYLYDPTSAPKLDPPPSDSLQVQSLVRCSACITTKFNDQEVTPKQLDDKQKKQDKVSVLVDNKTDEVRYNRLMAWPETGAGGPS
jgi:hypothetical protein